MNNQILSSYIHIPFCKEKCFYCDFNSFSNKDNYVDEYFKMINKEISLTYDYLVSKAINTNLSSVYFGGGTPSAVDAKFINEIMSNLQNKFILKNDAEVTIECNPESASFSKLEKYKSAGINRISIGLQSSNDQILKSIGRIHTYNDFKTSFKNAQNAGFKNINVDLICGLIDQYKDEFYDSIRELINMGISHLSLYSLSVEQATPMEKIYNQMKDRFPDENDEREMFWGAKKILENNKFSHYEISNFAKNGFDGKHNTYCWQGKEYFGFGAGAHSFYNNRRFSNVNSIEEYIEILSKAKSIYDVKKQENTLLTENEKENEYFLLGFRLLKGVSRFEFEKMFNKQFDLYLPIINKLLQNKLIEKKGDYYSLSNKGLDYANEVFMEFV